MNKEARAAVMRSRIESFNGLSSWQKDTTTQQEFKLI
jgi:hypothetical protein